MPSVLVVMVTVKNAFLKRSMCHHRLLLKLVIHILIWLHLPIGLEFTYMYPFCALAQRSYQRGGVTN
jgi:hypothetical protein